MDQQNITTEMIEFTKSVERLWATHETCQKRFYEDEPVNAGQIDLNRHHDRAGYGDK